MTQESTIETYLVKRVVALGGFSLKGAVPGRRFLDRICIMPDGVTLWIEVKKPKGGKLSRLQEATVQQLLDLGHFAFVVKTEAEVDAVLYWSRFFYNGLLFVSRADNQQFVSTAKGLVRWGAIKER